MESHQQHKKASPRTVRVLVVTVSDTRTPDTDASGDLIARALEGDGHRVVGRRIVRDDPPAVRSILRQAVDDPAVEAVILNGGTGISGRDGTFEVVVGILDKTLDGFGEIFRFLSYQDIGSPAIMSRAVAGVSGETMVLSIPGSPKACALAMDKLILPELGHMVFEIHR